MLITSVNTEALSVAEYDGLTLELELALESLDSLREARYTFRCTYNGAQQTAVIPRDKQARTHRSCVDS